MSIQDNIALIRSLKDLEPKTFEHVYKLYYPRLKVFIAKFNLPFLQSDDFVQETFMKLYQNASSLREDVLLDKQVFIICRNSVLNHLKREKKFSNWDESNFILENLPEIEWDDSTDENITALKKLVDSLPEKRREIFMLHKFDLLSYEEIIAKTQLSKKTIANHIYLAFSYLKEELKKSSK